MRAPTVRSRRLRGSRRRHGGPLDVRRRHGPMNEDTSRPRQAACSAHGPASVSPPTRQRRHGAGESSPARDRGPARRARLMLARTSRCGAHYAVCPKTGGRERRTMGNGSPSPPRGAGCIGGGRRTNPRRPHPPWRRGFCALTRPNQDRAALSCGTAAPATAVPGGVGRDDGRNSKADRYFDQPSTSHAGEPPTD